MQILNRFNGRGNDPDGDGIPSSEEPTEDRISTLSNDPDTYRMGSSYSDYGDQEVRCRKIEKHKHCRCIQNRIGQIPDVKARINLDLVQDEGGVFGMKIIKCIGVLACLVLPFIGHAGDLESAVHGIVTNLLTSADLKTYFQSIEIGMTNVVLKYHAHGLRYKRTIDNGQPVINKYGEVVNLSIDHTMRMVSKGIVLMFDGVSNGNIKGFVISQRTDLRSLGGSVGIKRAFLVLEKNGESVSPEIVLENVESVLGGGTDAYSNGPVGGVPKSSHEVVRRCKELLKPMSDIVNGYSDVTVLTNKGVVCVNVSNDVRRCTLHYSLLSGGCPKMIVQRSPSVMVTTFIWILRAGQRNISNIRIII